MKPYAHLSFWRSTTLHAAMIGIVWSPVLPAIAAPAQRPLFSRAASPIAPNIVLTFDDSGSMSWSHLPDSLWPYTVTPIMHPNDPEGYVYKCLAPTSTTEIKMLQVRSPAFNKAYYDPTIYYRPWGKADGTPAPNASYTAAAAQPSELVTGATLSSTINLSTTYSGLRAPWCVASNNNARYYYTGSQQDTDICDANNDSKCSAMAFNPGIYYRFKGDLTNTSTYTVASNYELINLNDTEANFNVKAIAKHADRTDCAGTKCTLAEERANFANWFTYYRSRNFIAKAGVSRAFGTQRGDMRIGYGRINNTSVASELSGVAGAPSSTIVRGVRSFELGSTTRNQFFTWLYGVDASGGTPLRRAMDDVGKYYSVTADIGPWGNNPGVVTTTSKTAQTNQKACRKSYHILTTDGYWNGSAANTTGAQGNVDNTKGPEIYNLARTKRYQYDPAAVTMYRDNGSGTLADVAMYYWNHDLHPDLDNKVPPAPGSDPDKDLGDHGFWQHMTTFTVGLGVLGSVKDTSDSNTPPAGGWPIPPSDGNNEKTVDDLWHAAVNGRGDSLQATRPDEFANALSSFLEQINAAQVPVTSTAFSSFVVTSTSKRYRPTYDPATWTGKFEAFSLTSNPNTPLWDASKLIPSWESRKVATWHPKNGTTAFGVGMDAAVLRAGSLWGGTAPTDDLIKFILGDRTNEGSQFRCRGAARGTSNCTTTISKGAGRLGDITNSRPLYVKDTLDMSYQNLPTGGGSYREFVALKKSRSDGVVFVGANDGMLHAFRDSSGVEVFSYIPYAVYGNLSRLADKQYGDENQPATEHRFFVDGQLTEADAFLGGSWTNLVIGSTGAGARAVFAIRVPAAGGIKDPAAMNVSNLMWEFNSTDDARLGYVMQPAAVGPTKDGKWVALVGNGPDNSDGKGYLFILDVQTGKPLAVIPAGTGGLGGVSVVRDIRGVIMAAYAGDSSGNLWRFDLQEGVAAAKVSFGGQPLFTAGSGKPITAAPSFFGHPEGGLMVVFGTGRLYAEGDQDSTGQQTLYGVWDKTIPGTASTPAAAPVVKAEDLVAQSFDSTPTTINGETYYKSSTNSIDWISGKRGWSLNLTLSPGQRSIYAPLLVDTLAYFSTVVPRGAGDDCEGTSSTGFGVLVEALSGSMVINAITDTNRDGMINKSDSPVSSWKVGDPEPPTRLWWPPDANDDNCPGCGPLDLSGQRIQPPSKVVQRHWRTIANFPRNVPAPGK